MPGECNPLCESNPGKRDIAELAAAYLRVSASGVWRHHALLRSASLLVLLCTVGKVFLYDASELTGLYRVASFFGLGLSLLALSRFYSKRVFRDAKDAITAH